MSRLLKMFTRADFGTYEIMETYGIGAWERKREKVLNDFVAMSMVV